MFSVLVCLCSNFEEYVEYNADDVPAGCHNNVTKWMFMQAKIPRILTIKDCLQEHINMWRRFLSPSMN